MLNLPSAISKVGVQLIHSLEIKHINNAHKYGYLESCLASLSFWLWLRL